MNSLDSRRLHPGDTFAQRFTAPGIYRYEVGTTGCGLTHDDHARFEINVADKGTEKPKTHYISVTIVNGAYEVDNPKVGVRAGDVVMWSTAQRAAGGFSVRGRSGEVEFDSAFLVKNAMYSHAFGLPGTFEWTNPNDRSLKGVVVVQAHSANTREDCQAYAAKLSQATLVMIDAPKAHPHKVSIFVGQTVFFAVRSSEGVAVVDRQLVDAATVALNPQPLPPRERSGTSASST